MYVHGFTTAKDIVKDLVTALTTGDTLTPENNWTLVEPADLAEVTNTAVLKVQPKVTKKWVKKEPLTIADGEVTLTNTLAPKGGTRVFVRDKKYNLSLQKEGTTPDVMEYVVLADNKLKFNAALNGKQILVDYEMVVDIAQEYYVKLDKPAIRGVDKVNNHFINWVIGENYDTVGDNFPADHFSTTGKLSWFRETANSELIAKDWLPIEYWISFDRNAAAGVVMADPGLSVSDWLSSPFYFGSLEQIEGALETDLKGNFGGFAGSDTEPTLMKHYGDYTGNGMTDVIMASSKTGRPYQAHKVAVFGGYEFREKTFNGQSHHTGKHPVSDIVLVDVHENDRGTLRRCIAAPRVGKEHGSELIYQRYISGEEKTYLFLNINAPYTPFSTSPDVLLGFAIQVD